MVLGGLQQALDRFVVEIAEQESAPDAIIAAQRDVQANAGAVSLRALHVVLEGGVNEHSDGAVVIDPVEDGYLGSWNRDHVVEPGEVPRERFVVTDNTDPVAARYLVGRSVDLEAAQCFVAQCCRVHTQRVRVLCVDVGDQPGGEPQFADHDPLIFEEPLEASAVIIIGVCRDEYSEVAVAVLDRQELHELVNHWVAGIGVSLGVDQVVQIDLDDVVASDQDRGAVTGTNGPEHKAGCRQFGTFHCSSSLLPPGARS